MPEAERQRLDIQIAIEEGDWPEEAQLTALAEKVLERAAHYLARHDQPFLPAPVELSLVFTNDDEITAINHEWRGQNKPTNVLSFPAYPIEPGDEPGPMLGDIIIAHETVLREAVDLDKSFSDHLTHLMVHGFLHLFGYDHMDAEEAEEMEGLECRILAELGLSNPYAGQDLAGPH